MRPAGKPTTNEPLRRTGWLRRRAPRMARERRDALTHAQQVANPKHFLAETLKLGHAETNAIKSVERHARWFGAAEAPATWRQPLRATSAWWVRRHLWRAGVSELQGTLLSTEDSAQRIGDQIRAGCLTVYETLCEDITASENLLNSLGEDEVAMLKRRRLGNATQEVVASYELLMARYPFRTKFLEAAATYAGMEAVVQTSMYGGVVSPWRIGALTLFSLWHAVEFPQLLAWVNDVQDGEGDTRATLKQVGRDLWHFRLRDAWTNLKESYQSSPAAFKRVFRRVVGISPLWALRHAVILDASAALDGLKAFGVVDVLKKTADILLVSAVVLPVTIINMVYVPYDFQYLVTKIRSLLWAGGAAALTQDE
jgi:hypothetical protein